MSISYRKNLLTRLFRQRSTIPHPTHRPSANFQYHTPTPFIPHTPKSTSTEQRLHLSAASRTLSRLRNFSIRPRRAARTTRARACITPAFSAALSASVPPSVALSHTARTILRCQRAYASHNGDAVAPTPRTMALHARCAYHAHHTGRGNTRGEKAP